MKISDDDLNLLQTINKSAALDFPCPSEVVEAAQPFIEAGVVAVTGQVVKNGAADLSLTDEGKWKLLAAGRNLQD
jgi:hypothetical protein